MGSLGQQLWAHLLAGEVGELWLLTADVTRLPADSMPWKEEGTLVLLTSSPRGS